MVEKMTNKINGQDFYEKTKKIGNLVVTFDGDGNSLIVDEKTRFNKAKINFRGNNSKVQVDPTKFKLTNLVVVIFNDSKFYMGKNCSVRGAHFLISEGRSVKIGEDAMISSGVDFKVTDVHLIYDVNTDERVNMSKDIVLGSHVWIAENVRVLKGVCVGKGSILGENAVVTKEVPENSIAVGNPAKIVKKGEIYWRRTASLPFRKEK